MRFTMLTVLLSYLLFAAWSERSVQDKKKSGTLREHLEDALPNERWFYDDWEKARTEAKKSGKPIFAVFRCVT